MKEVLEKRIVKFITKVHGDQVRKYTEEPYTNHLKSVARIVKQHTTDPKMIAAAYCHDVLEDTPCTETELTVAMMECGFDKRDAEEITHLVVELTDEYIHSKYPHFSREIRKRFEAKRLHKISHKAQTIKYADLIDNTSSIVLHDEGFAVVYLEEKDRILSGMNRGNPILYKRALKTLREALEVLE